MFKNVFMLKFESLLLGCLFWVKLLAYYKLFGIKHFQSVFLGQKWWLYQLTWQGVKTVEMSQMAFYCQYEYFWWKRVSSVFTSVFCNVHIEFWFFKKFFFKVCFFPKLPRCKNRHPSFVNGNNSKLCSKMSLC